MTPLRQRAAYYPITLMSRCYVDQQIGPTLSSCNRRRSSELRQSWATVVELSWNNSRTRVGVAELSAGRVAWARDAEAMSRLGNDSDFSMTFSDFQSRIAGSPKSIPFIHRLPGLSSVMFGDVRRCSAMFGDIIRASIHDRDSRLLLHSEASSRANILFRSSTLLWTRIHPRSSFLLC